MFTVLQFVTSFSNSSRISDLYINLINSNCKANYTLNEMQTLCIYFGVSDRGIKMKNRIKEL